MRVLKIFGVIVFAGATITSLSAVLTAGSVANAISYLFSALVCAGITYLLVRSVWIKPKKDAEAAALAEAQRQAHIREIESMTELPVVAEPSGIILRDGEVCCWQCQAKTLIVKNQVVGKTGSHGGSSLRVTKNVTWHSGSSSGRTIRDNVTYTYPGIFSFTTQRVIMTGEKGFDYPMEKLTAAAIYGEYRGCVFQFGQNSFTILMDEPQYVPKLLELLKKQGEAK